MNTDSRSTCISLQVEMACVCIWGIQQFSSSKQVLPNLQAVAGSEQVLLNWEAFEGRKGHKDQNISFEDSWYQNFCLISLNKMVKIINIQQ